MMVSRAVFINRSLTKDPFILRLLWLISSKEWWSQTRCLSQKQGGTEQMRILPSSVGLYSVLGGRMIVLASFQMIPKSISVFYKTIIVKLLFKTNNRKNDRGFVIPRPQYQQLHIQINTDSLIVHFYNIFSCMRSVVLKEKHILSIKTITQSSLLQQKVGQDQKPDHSVFGCFNIVHSQHLTIQDQKQGQLKESGHSPFDAFGMAAPKLRTQGTETQEKIADNQLKLSRPKQQMHRTQIPFKKTISCSPKFTYSNISINQQGNNSPIQKITSKNSLAKKTAGKILQSIRKKNQNNFIVHIQKLRQAELKAMKNEQSEEACSKAATKADGQIMPQNFMRSERAKNLNVSGEGRHEPKPETRQLKQKVMLKLSRRHIYHTLKHKSQILSKVKLKSYHHVQNPQENPQMEDIDTRCNHNFRLHYAVNKTHGIRTPPNPLRNPIPLLSGDESLRIDSKQAQIENMTRMRQSVSPQRVKQSEMKSKIKINTLLGTFSSKDYSQNEALETLNNSITGMTMLNLKQKPKSPANNVTGNINIFRELTPWCSDELD